MNIKKLTLKSPDYPSSLREIDAKPKQLFVMGDNFGELLKRKRVAIVGTRRISPYGQRVTEEITAKLAEQGIVIISGLAFGVDALAHRTAVDAGGYAIAVLPSPLDNVVPQTNRRLAARILEQGGALVSEYASGEVPFKQNFIARNRLVSGLADAVLITEAGEKSGALYTAGFAIKQHREVMAVPGNIYHPNSKGTHYLIKSSQAHAVTSYTDVLNILGINDHLTPVRQVKGRNAHEQAVLDLLLGGFSDGEQLLEKSKLSVSEFNQTLTMLEIGGKIRALGSNNWALH